MNKTIPEQYKNYKLPQAKIKKALILNNKKQCRLCKEWKDISLFGTFLQKKRTKYVGIWKADSRYINSRCKKCSKETTKKWSLNNSIYIKERQQLQKENNKKLIFNHYGKYCNCCGESEEMFLTFDHVNNDGAQHRRKDSKGKNNSHAGNYMYKWIVKNNFPDSIQILCFNCNCGRQRNKGLCPHKK